MDACKTYLKLLLRKMNNINGGYLSPLATTCTVTGLGWLLHEIHATIKTLQTIGRVDLIRRGSTYIHVDEETTKGLVMGRDGFMEYGLGLRRLTYWVHSIRQKLAWRLLCLCQTEPEWRLHATRNLASFDHLTDADLLPIAQACDAHTAVGLARSRGLRKGIFLRPPSSFLYKVPSATQQDLIIEMRDVLHKLNQESDHLCVKYFLLKAFPDYEAQSNYLLDTEVMLTEPWTILMSQDNLLPLCVQALDHHVSTIKNEHLLVKVGCLPLLMAIYQLNKENDNIANMICRILTRICTHPEYLTEIYASGWVGVLADWADGAHSELSLLATHCLANLDRDEACAAHYGRHVMPLHPARRAPPPLIDVVFVHGLIGSVLSTWRQRNHYHVSVGLHTDEMETVSKAPSDEHTREYLLAMSELTATEWDHLGDDFEFVVSDFPVSTSAECNLQYTLSGKDKTVRECAADKSYSMCWPRDWLPKDCPSLRVLGVHYESRLSEWFPSCSEKFRIKSLEERSAIVLEELKRCGIGQRPTVWVAHSMGGLLVKKMLTKALLSEDQETSWIARSSAAVVFLSTPHLGCPLAKLNDVLSYLLWPSTEVEELRHNSQILNDLHTEFQNLMNEVNMKIVTFAEANSTRISTIGLDLHIVPPEFSYFDVGDVFEMPCDHACVAKPYDRLSFIYQTVLSIIKTSRDDALSQN